MTGDGFPERLVGDVYFHVPKDHLVMATVVDPARGCINYFGPKHGGSMAVSLAIPTVIVVVLIAALSLPHLR